MSLLELYRLADAAVSGERMRMMLFPIGTWKSAKYPQLPLTRELADEIIANFEAGVLGTEPVVDSSGRHDTSAEAAGWIKRVYVAPTKDGGEALFADWEPTDLGASLLNERRYVYNSVEIGDVVDNASGKRIGNVLRSATLTNTPVLRMLPPVLEAGEAIAASESVELALSEVLAEDEDPVATLVGRIDDLLSELSGALKGKVGITAIRTMLREVKAKASAHTLADDSFEQLREELGAALGAYIVDFGLDWVVFEPMESMGEGGGSRYYRAPYVKGSSGISFGQPVEVAREVSYEPVSPSLSEPSVGAPAEAVGDSTSDAGVGQSAQPKEKRMSELTELLKLSEGADDAVILAEVQKVTERNAELEAKLAEGERADRLRKLEESIAGGHVLPAERDALAALAESAPETFEATLTAREGVKVIDLAEHGSGQPPAEGASYEDPSVELAEKAKARAAKDGSTYSAAERLVLAEDPDLAERYRAYRLNPRREA